MFRKTVIVGVSVLSLAFAGVAFSAGKGAKTIVLKGGSLGNVKFPHENHQYILKSCRVCHKLFPRQAGSIDELIAGGLLQKKQVMNNCITCHKETEAKGKDAGPTSCKGCHVK